MSEESYIQQNYNDQGVLILQVCYYPFLPEGPGVCWSELRFLLAKRYEDYHKVTSDSNKKSFCCTVEIQCEVVGSPLIRALLELWKVVYKNNGSLSCVNYPKNYIDAITTLGLPTLPRFKLDLRGSESTRSRWWITNLWHRRRDAKG